MKKNICFIANYTKTYFFDAISDFLVHHNIEIYWIVVNRKNFDFLVKKYSSKNILYLPKSAIMKMDNKPVGEFKLNELIYGDRAMKYDYSGSIKYLTNIQLLVCDFIKNNSIETIFGEVTWAHEILIHRISVQMKNLNSRYLEMHTTRIPSGRFLFFTNEYHSKFHILNRDFHKCKLPEGAFELKKPDYLAINDLKMEKSMSFKGHLERLKYFFSGEHLDPNDVTLLSSKSIHRKLIPIQNELNKKLYQRVKTVKYDFLTNKKFILVTLHKQPEASIDILGRYNEDQAKNIIDIWRNLPQDWYLVVKEHSNAIGDRSLKWFKNLSKFKNIVFAHEKLDSYILIDMCQAVFTITGTIAYEAALKNKRAFIMSDVFFSEFTYVKTITVDSFRKSLDLKDIIEQLPEGGTSDDEYIKKKIYFNSFIGVIGDPLNNPRCMEKSNLDNVSNAILSIL